MGFGITRTPRPAPTLKQDAAAPQPRTRAIARGEGIKDVSDRILAQSPAHHDAVLSATLSGLQAMAADKKLATLPFASVHLLHAVYPSGANVQAAHTQGLAALKGVQVGHSGLAHDSLGNTHVYSLAYIR